MRDFIADVRKKKQTPSLSVPSLQVTKAYQHILYLAPDLEIDAGPSEASKVGLSSELAWAVHGIMDSQVGT